MSDTFHEINIFVDKLQDFTASYGLRIIGSILIVVIGWVVVSVLLRFFRKAFHKTKLDPSLCLFVLRTINIFLNVLIILSALSNLGVSTTGLLATLSAAAVAVSLALKDSLGNLAGGIMMLITRPFSTGDFIEVDGASGIVLKIDMIHTIIRTVDNRQVVIPNGQLVNKTVTNYSKEKIRRMDLDFGISYNNDPDAAKSLIMEVVKAHPMALDDPAPFVRVSEHAESAVIITLRAWCETGNYWQLHFDLLEQVLKIFDENGIVIPFNQLDVHVVQQNNEN